MHRVNYELSISSPSRTNQHVLVHLLFLISTPYFHYFSTGTFYIVTFGCTRLVRSISVEISFTSKTKEALNNNSRERKKELNASVLPGVGMVCDCSEDNRNLVSWRKS